MGIDANLFGGRAAHCERAKRQSPFPLNGERTVSETIDPIQERGPWRAELRKRRALIYSDDFTHDVTLLVSGDFRDDAQRLAYANEIAHRLNEYTRLMEPLPVVRFKEGEKPSNGTISIPADDRRVSSGFRAVPRKKPKP
jgi:hypothetical protein